MTKKAFFRFEASPLMGAGHAIRSCVLADELRERGWECQIVTSSKTYDFLTQLTRFQRVDPDEFYANPIACDLLVIDHYDLDITYETHFRSFAQKIMVIDDLANRKHDCDVLLDQTYGRDEADYRFFVPAQCKILTGSDYVLIRKEIRVLIPHALEKRKETKEVSRILVSLGGSDLHNYTIQALERIKNSGFSGALDVVLGFSSHHRRGIEFYLKEMHNKSAVHINPNLPKLMLDADLAIGAAGSSVWERACLGLPQILIKTAENQSLIFNNVSAIVESENILNKHIALSGKYFVLDPKIDKIISNVF